MAVCKRCKRAFTYDVEVGYATDICGPFCHGVLSQQEKIERLSKQLAEAERIIGCARVALGLAVGWAGFLYAKWDADQDHKVGKGLLALAGRMPGYAPDTDGIHSFIAKVNEYKTGGGE